MTPAASDLTLFSANTLPGRDDDAREVIAALADLPQDHQLVDNEFVSIKDTVEEMSKGSFRDLFTMDENRHLHRVILAYVNQMFQQVKSTNPRYDRLQSADNFPDQWYQPHHLLRRRHLLRRMPPR